MWWGREGTSSNRTSASTSIETYQEHKNSRHGKLLFTLYSRYHLISTEFLKKQYIGFEIRNTFTLVFLTSKYTGCSIHIDKHRSTLLKSQVSQPDLTHQMLDPTQLYAQPCVCVCRSVMIRSTNNCIIIIIIIYPK